MMRSRCQSTEAVATDELFCFGIVAEVDAGAGHIAVDCGDVRTSPIRTLELRSGETRTCYLPSVGEQVVLSGPDGEIEAGIAFVGVTSDAFCLPGVGAAKLVQFSDDAALSYDPEAHAVAAVMPAGATAEISIGMGVSLRLDAGDVTIRGKVTINGDVAITGKAQATSDVLASNKSLKTHKHLGVTAGGSISGPPQ